MAVFSSNSQPFHLARNWVLTVCGLAVRPRVQIGVGEGNTPGVALPQGRHHLDTTFNPGRAESPGGRLTSGLTHGVQEVE